MHSPTQLSRVTTSQEHNQETEPIPLQNTEDSCSNNNKDAMEEEPLTPFMVMPNSETNRTTTPPWCAAKLHNWWTWIRNHADLLVVMLATFVSEACRGVVLPTLAAGILAQGGTYANVAEAVSLFSVGRLITTLALSYFADWRKSCRDALLVVIIINSCGQVIFAFSAGVAGQQTMVLVSRFVIGMGTGSLGVCRGYLTNHSSVQERTKIVAYSSLFQFLGFMLAPGLGTISRSFSAPAYVMLVWNMLLLFAVMRIMPRIDALGTTLMTDDGNTPPPQPANEKRTNMVIALFLALNFIIRGAMADAETLGPQAHQALNVGDDDIIEDTGIFFVVLGVIGCVMYLLIDPMVKYVGCSEHVLFLVGIASIAGGGIFLIDIVYQKNIAIFTIGAVMLWCIANPLTQTFTISLFSKILDRKSQVVYMGWLSVAGSLGRIIFPLFSALVSQTVAFVCNTVLCVLIAFVYIAVWRSGVRRESRQVVVGGGSEDQGEISDFELGPMRQVVLSHVDNRKVVLQ